MPAAFRSSLPTPRRSATKLPTASKIPKAPKARVGQPPEAINKSKTTTTPIDPAAAVPSFLVSAKPNQTPSRASAEMVLLQSQSLARPASHHPHYIGPHTGEPCTLGSLDHLLECGHKVLTSRPEACASNCRQSTSPYINPRSIDKPFACMACILQTTKRGHDKKEASFRAELTKVATAAAGGPGFSDWVSEKVKLVQFAWWNQQIEQVIEKASRGRFCQALYVDAGCQALCDEALSRLRGRQREDLAPSSTRKISNTRCADTHSKDDEESNTSQADSWTYPSPPSSRKVSPSRLPTLKKRT